MMLQHKTVVVVAVVAVPWHSDIHSRQSHEPVKTKVPHIYVYTIHTATLCIPLLCLTYKFMQQYCAYIYNV